MNYRELNNTFKFINTWYKKKSKVLSIKTRPFNTAFIFYDILNKVAASNRDVLYVVCTKKQDFNCKNNKKYFENIIDKMTTNINQNKIDFIFIDEIEKIEKDYDLVIFDDITIFSQITVEKLRSAVEKIYWRTNKIIIYSCERVFPIGDKLDLIYLLLPLPMIEPRIINTRIKLEEDIPLVLYEYIKWYKENRKTLVVFVPSEDKLNKVYKCYKNTLKRNNIRVIKFAKGEDYKFVNDIINEENEGLVIITNNLGSYLNSIDDLNIVILFADSKSFNYKKIVYTCGAINIKANNLSEVLLVSRDVSYEMDKAKNIIREYNKILWDRKILK